MAAPYASCAVPGAVDAPGDVSAVLAHGALVGLPGANGEALAAATLEQGGSIALGFSTLGDTLAYYPCDMRGAQ
jgi:hypothetical protein